MKGLEKKRKKILFAASEAVPFCKTGGLADVCGALPAELRKRGHDVRLVLPRHWAISHLDHELREVCSPMGVPMGNSTVWCGVHETRSGDLPVYFIEHEGFFGRAGIYNDGKWEYSDNAERFGFFSRACLQLCKDIGFSPDIIHCNDWQTALMPAYLKIREKHAPVFSSTASVFTIHNIGHQGVFPAEKFSFLDLGHENFTEPRLESFGDVHFMKGAIFYSDCISTVSPSYAEEILSPIGGNGLGRYISRRQDDLRGILNGADYSQWNPERDPLIPFKYSAKDLSGKELCKKTLQKEFFLKEDQTIPVIGIVSRFVEQKGLPLLMPVMEYMLKEMVAQFVFLGSGEKHIEDFFGGLPGKYPGQVGSWIGYSNERAHLIEAGSDMFLMPSLYEPCGLNQIYSLRYGTLPIVRSTGGLKDTVHRYNETSGEGTGFMFDHIDPMDLYYTVGLAVSTYYDRRNHFENMKVRAMNERFTWEKAAEQYEELYEHALWRRSTWIY